jgi:SHS2 domain-containing protein
MRAVYEWVEHTAELELRVLADSAEELFAEAMRALAELMDAEEGGEPARHELTASAPDRATLLAEWLNELVYLAESRGFVPDRVERFQLGEVDVEATVSGRTATPRPLVKAVTYHGLSLAESDGRWSATVVLDV